MVSSKTSLSAWDVRKMLDSGVGRHEIVRRLIETGVWSRAGAAEIVQFMTSGPDPLMKQTASLGRLEHPRRQR
jgi:hypothetical protein